MPEQLAFRSFDGTRPNRRQKAYQISSPWNASSALQFGQAMLLEPLLFSLGWIVGLTPVAGAKSYAWSYLAGWYAEERTSYEAFCSGLWDDPALAAALKSLLIDCGAWAVALDLTK